MLKGRMIGLRSMRPDDAWLLYKWYNDPRITGELGSRRLLIGVSLDDIKSKMEKALASDDRLHLMVVDMADERTVGAVSLRDIDRRAATGEMRVLIGDPSLWGTGRGKEAVALMRDYGFSSLNLHRIQARVPDYNQRALSCFEACGFEREGVLRDDHYHDGSYRSSVLLSALRKEGGRR